MRYLLVLILALIIIPSSFAVNITDARSAVENAEKIIQEMVESNFSVSFVNDTLMSAKNNFMEGDYESVIEKTDIIEKRKEKAYEISDSLSSLDMRITDLEDMGIDTSSVRDIQRRAEREFYYENYDEADRLVDEAFSEISDLEASQTILKTRYDATKNAILTFFEENKMLVITVFISLAFISIISYMFIKRIKIKKELKNLSLEKKSIEVLIKDLQERRYKENKLSKRFYDVAMSKYKTRMRNIEKNILSLQKKIGKKLS